VKLKYVATAESPGQGKGEFIYIRDHPKAYQIGGLQGTGINLGKQAWANLWAYYTPGSGLYKDLNNRYGDNYTVIGLSPSGLQPFTYLAGPGGNNVNKGSQLSATVDFGSGKISKDCSNTVFVGVAYIVGQIMDQKIKTPLEIVGSIGFAIVASRNGMDIQVRPYNNMKYEEYTAADRGRGWDDIYRRGENILIPIDSNYRNWSWGYWKQK
jgi:hypothetical protein